MLSAFVSKISSRSAMCSLLLILASSLGLVAAADAAHTEDNTDISRFQPGSLQQFTGPFIVRWLNINPLQYPGWYAYDSTTCKSGPSLTPFNGGVGALQCIESGAATPAALPTPQALPSGTYLTTDLRPRGSSLLDVDEVGVDDCALSGLTSASSEPAYSDIRTINDCFEKIRLDLQSGDNALFSTLQKLRREERKAFTYHQRLSSVIDVILSDSFFSTNSVAPAPSPDPLGSKGTTDVGLAILDRNLQTLVIDDVVSPTDTNITKHLDASLKFLQNDPANGYISARQLQARINRLPPWPTDRIALNIARITKLQDYLTNRSLAQATPPKKNEPFNPESGSCLTVLTPNSKKVTSLTISSPKSCNDQLTAWLSRLQANAEKTDVEKSYTSDLAFLNAVANQVLAPLSPARFHYINHEDCHATNTSRRDHVFTLVLSPTKVFSDVAVCQSRLVLSGGVAFSSLQQRTYQTVPYNPYGHQSLPANVPSPIPAGAGFIEPAQVQDVRAFPVQLISYKIADLPALGPETEFYSTFGLGLTESTGGTGVDFIAGASVSFTRAAFLTFGVHLGQQNVLSPGYNAGDFTVSTPQMTTRYTPAFTLVASYGGA